MGSKHYVSGLAAIGQDIQVISNQEMTLKDGTRAYRTKIKWLYQGVFPVTTLLVSTFKDGKCVYLAANPTKKTQAAEEIVHSLTFH